MKKVLRGISRQVLAWSLAIGVTLLVVVFMVVFLTPLTPKEVFSQAGAVTTLLFVGPYMAYALVGGLIAAKRPENPIGWLIVAGAGSIAGGALCDLFGSLLIHGQSLAGPWVALGGVLWSGGISPSTLCFILAALLFPDGKLPARGWRWVAYGLAGLMVLDLAFQVFDPVKGALGIGYSSDPGVNATSPLALSWLGEWVSPINSFFSIATLASLVLAVGVVLLRLRGATAERSHQVKWFAAGIATTAVFLVVLPGLLFPSVANPNLIETVVVGSMAGLGGLALPVSVGVAVLRYRLYDIDILINRALVYGSLAALISSIYIGIAVGIGSLIGSGGQPNLGLSILATAIVALGFQPARERVQKVANRLVFGKRATPYEVLAEFSERVAESYASDEVLTRMAKVLAEGTGAERAEVWLHRDKQMERAASYPTGSGEPDKLDFGGNENLLVTGMDRSVLVSQQGEVLGALAVNKRRGEAFTPIELKLMDDLAHQAGLVLKNVGLTADLQARLLDLRASRQRLVSAQDDERRKLERNLHDGAQQYLVAIKVKLGLVEMLVSKDIEKAQATLVGLKTDADEALETLRDLARGIYPPLLADRGLVVALQSQANKATVPVTIEDKGVQRYAPDIEATVYFCVLEALQNIQKYAKATKVNVLLQPQNDFLQYAVQDDGEGFDPARVSKGAGLTNMSDRLEALGGSLRLESKKGRGTTIIGLLPVPPLGVTA